VNVPEGIYQASVGGLEKYQAARWDARCHTRKQIVATSDFHFLNSSECDPVLSKYKLPFVIL